MTSSPKGRASERLAALKGAIPSGKLRWLWLAGLVVLALVGYTILLWLPGSFVVPAAAWTAWVARRSVAEAHEAAAAGGSEQADP